MEPSSLETSIPSSPYTACAGMCQVQQPIPLCLGFPMCFALFLGFFDFLPTQFPVSLVLRSAGLQSQHAERLGWLLSFRSTLRLRFPESRGTGMGGARSPCAGSHGPNIRGSAGDRGEGRGARRFGWLWAGPSGRRVREGPSFSPAVVQRSGPGCPAREA